MNNGITASAVRAQLQRILTSEGFVRSHRIQRFLEFIVEETLAARSSQLGEYGIGVSVFDRGKDFEPALDPIVRNDARRLRAKLLEFYKTAEPGSLLIEMPKGGYVPVFSFAQPRAEAASDSQSRLAVFPFETLSTTTDSDLHGRFLCMSLTANLTGVEGLETVSHDFLQHAVSELRLSHAIQGTVVVSNERRRVIINLVRLTDARQLWAREFDFTPGYEYEITSTVVREVAGRLASRRPQALQLVRAA